jgi:hypothetical protein
MRLIAILLITFAGLAYAQQQQVRCYPQPGGGVRCVVINYGR